MHAFEWENHANLVPNWQWKILARPDLFLIYILRVGHLLNMSRGVIAFVIAKTSNMLMLFYRIK